MKTNQRVQEAVREVTRLPHEKAPLELTDGGSRRDGREKSSGNSSSKRRGWGGGRESPERSSW